MAIFGRGLRRKSRQVTTCRIFCHRSLMDRFRLTFLEPWSGKCLRFLWVFALPFRVWLLFRSLSVLFSFRYRSRCFEAWYRDGLCCSHALSHDKNTIGQALGDLYEGPLNISYTFQGFIHCKLLSFGWPISNFSIGTVLKNYIVTYLTKIDLFFLLIFNDLHQSRNIRMAYHFQYPHLTQDLFRRIRIKRYISSHLPCPFSFFSNLFFFFRINKLYFFIA